MGAVDERVAVPPVGRVGQLGEAVGAGGGVRGDQGAGRPVGAGGEDGEPGAAGGRHLPVVDGLDAGQRGASGGDPVAEPGHGRGGALDLHDDALRGVGHVPGQGELGGEAVQVGPEADALHHSPDGDPRRRGVSAATAAGPAERSRVGVAIVPVASGCAWV